MSGNNVPHTLVEAFRQGRGAVFVGAGASLAAGLPSWQNLVVPFAEKLRIQPDVGQMFSPGLLNRIPQYFENEFGRRALHHLLEEQVSVRTKKQSAVHRLIASLPARLFYTTNFDDLLEQALGHEDINFDLVFDEETFRTHTELIRPQVRKIHGTITHPNSLVFTRSDYARFPFARPLLVEALRHDLRSQILLFIGYSLSDPDFNNIYDNVFHTMGTLAQTHFVCLFNVSAYEAKDLRERRLEPIDLNRWSGIDDSEKLKGFLNELLEATSDVVHIKRFFGELSADCPIPIVITSREHESEGYVIYPACDVHTAQQLKHALARIGYESKIIADHSALENEDSFLKRDLILVCSPNGNRFTRAVCQRAEEAAYELLPAFSRSPVRSLRTASGTEFVADDPLDKSVQTSRTEYAVIARHVNPWSRKHKLFVLAGVHALGTHAIGDFLENHSNYRRLLWQTEPAGAILKIKYSECDPYNYTYTIGDVLKLE